MATLKFVSNEELERIMTEYKKSDPKFEVFSPNEPLTVRMVREIRRLQRTDLSTERIN